MSGRTPRLTLYGKAGCCLCDHARAAVREVVAEREREFEIDEVDISLDPRLHREYGERIPVLEVDGFAALELGFDAVAVREVVSRVAP